MNTLQAYILGKKYTDETAMQFGGLKGANCTIKSIVKEGNHNIVTFEWVNDQGETRESEMVVNDGESSISVDDELSEISENPVQNKVITEKLDEVFQSVSNGKTLIASAITDKGVPTDANATFETMAENIGEIEGGGKDNFIKKSFSEVFQPLTFKNFIDMTFTENISTDVESSLPTVGKHGYQISTLSKSSSKYAIEVISFIDGWIVDRVEMLYSDYNGQWKNFDDLIKIGYNVGDGSNYWSLEILGNIENYSVGDRIKWYNSNWQYLVLVESLEA